MREKLAQIERLKMRYGTVNAVTDVSFELYEGEILALIGPNGYVDCLMFYDPLRQDFNRRMPGRSAQTDRRQNRTIGL